MRITIWVGLFISASDIVTLE